MPLGGLNNIQAVRTANPGRSLFLSTLASTAAFAFGLAASAYYLGGNYPDRLLWYLSIRYVLLFLGELRAWWIPYLFRADPSRASRYHAMFGNTYTFIPERNGISPNALHVALHAATLAALIILGTLGV